MEGMTRSELAKRCGVNIESLRYYERRRLIDPPPRTEAGYRIYSQEDAVKVRFIKNAQHLGFTLKEIGDLLKLRVRNNKSCESVLTRAEKKLDEVENKINGLKSMRKVLKRLVQQCRRSAPTGACPILSSFESDGKI